MLTSPNKALKLGGLKTSYSMIPDDSLRQRFRQQLEKNSITSPNLFGVWGIILAYQHGLPWLDALNGYLQGNARYLAWIDVSADESSATQLTQHFARQAVVVIEDGSHYVQNGENYLQINFGSQRYWLERSTNRMQ